MMILMLLDMECLTKMKVKREVTLHLHITLISHHLLLDVVTRLVLKMRRKGD